MYYCRFAMGIPSYFSYIVKHHANLIRKIETHTIKVDNLYLDCNSIIYDSVHNIDFSKLVESDVITIIRSVIKKINEYIAQLNPSQNIFIAFDGVAPVAKLEQQRSRRYKSLYQNKISKSIFKDAKPEPWNTTAITPGTVFMKRLNEEIKKAYTNPSQFGVMNLILSTSDKPGEGEHKLFEYIRNHPGQHDEHNTIIYGLDADLIMLSINHLPISKNIFLFRETPHFIKSINSELNPNESYLIDIPELAKIITLDMNNGVELTTEQQNNRMYDYIFMCFLLGNDFMPHFPALNIRTGGIDKIVNAYKSTIGTSNENLTNGKKIYWKNVRRLIQTLSDSEEEFIRKEYKLRDKLEKRILPNTTPEDKFAQFESLPLYERSLEKYINPFKPNWRNRYYKCLVNQETTEEMIQDMCINYLKGLEWTIKYYTVGCTDWRWCYEYHYPPLLSDLLRYIPYFETEFFEKQAPSPVAELVQLCYVLPQQSLHLLPYNLYNKLIRDHVEWYKNDCKFIWAYCKYFWESHVVLPRINIDELEQIVKEIVS